MENLRNIPGFKTLKAWKHSIYWYIIDCTPGCGDPFTNNIGGLYETYGQACSYAITIYTGEYV